MKIVIVRMQGDFEHLYKIQNGKTVEFHILDDSQKLASIMKVMYLLGSAAVLHENGTATLFRQ